MIVSANHVSNLHQRVVNHHHVVVDGHAVGTQNDGIADDFVGKLNVSVNDVVKANGMLGNPQAEWRRLRRLRDDGWLPRDRCCGTLPE